MPAQYSTVEYWNQRYAEWVSQSCRYKSVELMGRTTDSVLDATHVASYFPAESFDLVIDKGCLDTMLCNKNFDEAVPAMLKGLHTILRNTGTLVIVSVGCPDNRMMYIEVVESVSSWILFQPSGLWKISVVKVPKRHVEYLEEACPTAALQSFGNISGTSPEARATSVASSSMSEERLNNFIYVCRKVM
ncbi:methyltransferase 13-like protein, putative [Babesia ovata]|uniref:Methyltransferase 13-like protein, putative n=1 Tax=Babesia ovata TaxID=189622 RepID=A0A2H6KEW3_9APIC|nr:methyltransferase 13-like protein, putative [Babesia ovata]GBE61538.1 methyltransferase 13-like protein, putative [Babesia ovata]